jgi:hypothetical protein
LTRACSVSIIPVPSLQCHRAASRPELCCMMGGLEARSRKRFQAKHALGLDPWVDPGSREENASKEKPGT